MIVTFAKKDDMGGMNQHQPAHHADRVEAAIDSGQAAKSAVVASWRRSSRLHRLDPSGARPPLRLTEAELRRTIERDEPLIRAAQFAIDRLYQAVGAVGCCVLLAGRDGVPVDRRGAPADDVTDFVGSRGAWPGAAGRTGHAWLKPKRKSPGPLPTPELPTSSGRHPLLGGSAVTLATLWPSLNAALSDIKRFADVT